VDRLEAGLAVDTARKAAGLRWQDLAELLERSLVWTTSALLGQQPISAEQAAVLGDKLDLDLTVIAALSRPPVRGAQVVDTSEPVIYRLQEAIQVYGPALKALIAEEFGDGIMSAIDFELTMARKPDPKGDRVVLTFDGKFLPYRVW
jgi:cyanate lyase